MEFCPECKVKQQDLSEKQLYKCPYCERDFCANHLEPKLVFYSASFSTHLIKNKKYREMVENDISRLDAHPCVPYTQKRITELEYEDRKSSEMLKRFLDEGKRERTSEEHPISGEYQLIPADSSVILAIRGEEQNIFFNVLYEGEITQD